MLWAAQILLGAFLLIGSGLPKTSPASSEIAGAIGLVVPRLAGLAATGLIGLMAGAALPQVLVLEPAWSAMPAVFAVVFASVAWDRRPETRELLHSFKR